MPTPDDLISDSQRKEFYVFVLWRLAEGKIAERWTTVTPAS
jgi:hypothetical protein